MRSLAILALSAVSVQAGLICTEGGFLPKKYCTIANTVVRGVASLDNTAGNIDAGAVVNKVEQSTVDTVQKAADKVKQDFGIFTDEAGNAIETIQTTTGSLRTNPAFDKNLMKFELTHNPVSLVMEYSKTAIERGIPAANAELTQSGHDLMNATLGFAEESLNQAISVMSLPQWADLSICLIAGGVAQAEQLGVLPKLTNRDISSSLATAATAAHATADILDVVSSCENKDFNKKANQLVFNITDPNQKIGAHMSDMAALILPAALGEEEASAWAGKKLWKLVIPGLESASTIVKQLVPNQPTARVRRQSTADPDLIGQYFDNKQEALAVQAHLSDPAWIAQNCKVGKIQPPPKPITSRRNRRAIIERRDDPVYLCCKVPVALPEPTVDFEVPSVDDDSQESSATTPTSSNAIPIYNTTYGAVSESQVHPDPAKLPVRKYATVAKTDILDDLSVLGISQVSMLPPVVGEVMLAKDVFKLLRGVFEKQDDPTSATTRSQLGLSSDQDAPGRQRTNSDYWLNATNANDQLASLQKFTTAVITEARNIVIALKVVAPNDPILDAINIDFFYTPPSPSAAQNPDPRGLHTSSSTLQLVASDVAGLVVKSLKDGSLFRPDLEDATWTLLPGMTWTERLLASAVQHAAFGLDMAKLGRVSMKVNI